MPTLVRTNQTKADLLQRKLEINSELRELRNRYDKPGVVEVPGDRQRVDDLIARHTPGEERCSTRGPWVCKTYSPRIDREEMIKNGSAWSAANDRGGWHHRLLRWAGVASAARHTRRREPATRDHPPKPTQSAPSKTPDDIGEVVAERIRPAEHLTPLCLADV